MFKCEKCGLCCQNLNLNSLYDDLNDGTGVCIYYNRETRLCNIYEKRPEKCNVDETYKYFAKYMSYENYINMNIEVCKKLKEGYCDGKDGRY